ncbi:substrate-binding periplasmic protein [Desulfotignum phosphitoxidans]|uniref:ABC transporter periplasmic substrate binding protein n=1 Tax=Desulfotignum phosphitoxidans DSM 13687 TaxID=1286635 RepID=S0G697_9BACT|nr:transporter substrate-binding domain-containing protein [Desulfotignum phosphitoxidans]EMS79936.1 ABC transporter periplasmic substrate binding protein [Desulfotignum phosphitoxidans DSM 13687]
MAKTLTRLLVLLVLAIHPVCLALADEILLAADPWCPYNCGGQEEHSGFMVDIARAVFEKNGHRVIYVTVPWARAIHGTRTGQYDGIIGAGRTETPDFVFPDIEQGLACHTFYVKKGNPWQYDGPASLDHVTLGVIRNYSYGTLFDTYIRQHQADLAKVQVISGESGLALNIRKLVAGRIEVLIEDRAVFQYFLHKKGIPDDFARAGTAAMEPVYIAFSPISADARKYADMLTREMAELRRSGALSDILKQYGLTDWRDVDK